jgi:hypothetical protein
LLRPPVFCRRLAGWFLTAVRARLALVIAGSLLIIILFALPWATAHPSRIGPRAT